MTLTPQNFGNSIEAPSHFPWPFLTRHLRLCAKDATDSTKNFVSLLLSFENPYSSRQVQHREYISEYHRYLKLSRNMKEEQLPCFNHRQTINNKKTRLVFRLLNSPAVYVVLLLLSYALGYLSAPISRSPPQPLSSPEILKVGDNLTTQLDNFRVKTRCAEPLPPQLVHQTILDRVFNSTSPYDNFPPAHVSGLLREKKLKGWGSYGEVFEHLIQKAKPKVIIEVGTFLGASALHMAELTRKLGLDSQILCIDDFRGWPGFRDRFGYVKMVNSDVLLLYQFLQNVIHKNATGSVLPMPFSSGSALEKLCEWGVFADLIEIDAGHDFNSAWADINRAYQILRPGGIIFGHDYFTAADNRGVRRAVNLFAQMNGRQIQTDGQHWVIDSA